MALKIGDIFRQMNNSLCSIFDHHLILKLSPELIRDGEFQKRADELITLLKWRDNPPSHVTFLLDGYGFIPNVYHYAFIQGFTEFLKACQDKSYSEGLDDWPVLFAELKNKIEGKQQGRYNQNCDEGYDLQPTGKVFVTVKRNSSRNFFVSVVVSRTSKRSQVRRFPDKQTWDIKRMNQKQFDFLETIVKEVSHNADKDTKIRFLEQNPEILFSTFRIVEPMKTPSDKELRQKLTSNFNVQHLLSEISDGMAGQWEIFLLTKLLHEQNMNNRISMTKSDAFYLWKFTRDRIIKGEEIQPLTLDLVESILGIDIRTGAPRGEEV